MTYVNLWYWFISHGVSIHEIDESIVFWFDWHKQKEKFQTNQWKAPLDHGQREPWLVNPFLDVSQFADPGHCEWKDSQVPLRTLVKHPRVLLLVFLQSFPRGTLVTLTRANVHWRNGNNQTFRDLLDMGSELRLILKDPKKHCGPSV